MSMTEVEHVPASWHPIFTALVIIAMFLSLALELLPAEVALMGASTVLCAFGITSIRDLASGFSNSGVLSIAVLYVCVYPLSRLPLLRKFLTRFLLSSKKVNVSVRRNLLAMYIFCAGFSMFLNNVPIVALMIPFIKDWCRERDLAPSMFLIPLSYSVIFGGVVTVIGSSTTLVVQGFLLQDGHAPFGFFELGISSGFILVAFGLFYVVFIGPFLLPKNGGIMASGIMNREAEFLIQITVEGNSNFCGRSVAKLMRKLPKESVKPVRIIRDNDDPEAENKLISIQPLQPKEKIRAKDRIVLQGPVQKLLIALISLRGITVNLEELQSGEDGLLEGERLPQIVAGDVEAGSPPTIVTPDQSTPAPLQPHRRRRRNSHASDASGSRRRGSQASEASGRRSHASAASDTSGNHLGEGGEGEEGEAEAELSDYADDDDDIDLIGENGEEEQKTEFFEVVLGRTNMGAGFTVGSGKFQRYYSATVVAVRQGAVSLMTMQKEADRDQTGKEISGLVLGQGDCLLILARDTFFHEWGMSTDFFMVSCCTPKEEDNMDERFYFNVPHWFPFGVYPTANVNVPQDGGGRVNLEVPEEGPKGKKRLYMRWYPYLSAIAFLVMIIVTAVTGVDILLPALCHAIFIVAAGLVNPADALRSIDGGVFIAVAASLGVGLAMERSGLALAISNVVLGHIGNKLVLFLVVGWLTTFSAAVVSTNASAAIIYPLVASVASERSDLNVHALAIIVAIASGIDFSTPFGFQCNLMVQGPGGYKFIDYVRIGLPLNFICPALVAFGVWIYDGRG